MASDGRTRKEPKEMLALPRITAVQNGAGTSNRPVNAGKVKTASNNPFMKLLSTLGASALKKGSRPESLPEIQRGIIPENTRMAGTDRAKSPHDRALLDDGIQRLLPRNDTKTRYVEKQEPAKPVAKNELPSKEPKSSGHGPGLESAESLATLAGSLKGANLQEGRFGKPSGERKATEANAIDADVPGAGSRVAGSIAPKEGPAVSVIDLRLKTDRRNASRDKPEGETSAATGKERPALVNPGMDLGAQALALRPADARDVETMGGSQPEPSAKAPLSLSESLAARLKESASEIVRSAQIVLRGGDTGLIRLRLEPESLGNVKIELKMTEKQISGKIIVESDIAGEAFKSSMDSLRDAFAESGFETTRLELEVRNGMSSGTGAEGGTNGGQSDDSDPYFSRSIRTLTAAVPALGTGGRDGILDMIV
jgi:hypothetical protein